jgi:hypothetical protein
MGYAAHERLELVSALGVVRRGDLIVALVGTPISFFMREKENGRCVLIGEIYLYEITEDVFGGVPSPGAL